MALNILETQEVEEGDFSDLEHGEDEEVEKPKKKKARGKAKRTTKKKASEKKTKSEEKKATKRKTSTKTTGPKRKRVKLTPEAKRTKVAALKIRGKELSDKALEVVDDLASGPTSEKALDAQLAVEEAEQERQESIALGASALSVLTTLADYLTGSDCFTTTYGRDKVLHEGLGDAIMDRIPDSMATPVSLTVRTAATGVTAMKRLRERRGIVQFSVSKSADASSQTPPSQDNQDVYQPTITEGDLVVPVNPQF